MIEPLVMTIIVQHPRIVLIAEVNFGCMKFMVNVRILG